MDIASTIAKDFECVLRAGLASSLTFGAGTEAEASVPAMLTETTIAAELNVGGERPKRTFSATLLAKLVPAGTRPGGLVRLDGVAYRIETVRQLRERPLTVIEFSEK